MSETGNRRAIVLPNPSSHHWVRAKRRTHQSSTVYPFPPGSGAFHSIPTFQSKQPFIFLIFLILTWVYVYWFQRERKGERNIDVKEKQGSAASLICPDQGLNLQPWNVLWLRIEPTTFWCKGQCSNKLSHSARAGQPRLLFILMSPLAPWVCDSLCFRNFLGLNLEEWRGCANSPSHQVPTANFQVFLLFLCNPFNSGQYPVLLFNHVFQALYSFTIFSCFSL